MSVFFGRFGRSRTNVPPTQAEILRNDAILLICVLVMLAAGWGVGVLALRETTRSVDLGPGLPTIEYPATWLPSVNAAVSDESSVEDVLFQARNASSASTFNSTLRVEALPVLPEDSLGALRVRMGLRRAQELDRYRELAAEPAHVLGGSDALLTTYAFLADPTRDSGGNGVPVVVEAQDLLFRHENEWLVVTLAADAGDWAQESADFAPVLRSLGLEVMSP